ncbi:MAG: hypothetical protein AB7F78_16665 [Hyphomicrobiaceae bacterium]
MSKIVNDRAISVDEIEAIARQGVSRAMAARGGITELTAEQEEAVSGAALASSVSSLRLLPPIIFGLILRPTWLLSR